MMSRMRERAPRPRARTGQFGRRANAQRVYMVEDILSLIAAERGEIGEIGQSDQAIHDRRKIPGRAARSARQYIVGNYDLPRTTRRVNLQRGGCFI